MISIIIASYNQQEYLPDAIESVLNQRWFTNELELIVIDDGSTDHSLEIANKYRSEFLSKKNAGKNGQLKDLKVISQVNKGLPSARNTGIMNADGEWILPLDADDILMPDSLSEIWKESNSPFCPDVVGLSFKEFGIRNGEIILMQNPTVEDFKTGNRIGYCSLIRKSALLEVGGYSPKMVWGYEDFHLWFNLLQKGKTFKTISKSLWLYRTKEKSMITESIKHHEELMRQIMHDFPTVFPEYVEIKTPLPC